MQDVLIIFLEYSNLHGVLHPACWLILENFTMKLIFLLLIFKKVQPAWPYLPYHILKVYQFWEFFQPAISLHPALLLDTPEYSLCLKIFLHGLNKISIITIDAFQRNSSETISKKFGLNQLPCFPSRWSSFLGEAQVQHGFPKC